MARTSSPVPPMSRRPQVPVRIMRAGVRGLVRPVLGPRMPVRAQRCWLAAVTRPTPLAEGVDVRAGELGGRPTEILVPRVGDPQRRSCTCTGAGSRSGHPPRTARWPPTWPRPALPRCTSSTTGWPPSTRSRPRSTTSSPPTGSCWTGARHPARTALAGDSAGGWLALTAALRLRDAGDPLPAALGLISPWLDLTGSSWPADRTDPMLRPAWLRRCAADFAGGHRPRRREFAPLPADLGGLPPMTVHVGSEEILLDDAVRLARAARAAGVAVDLRRLDGLWHVAHASAGMVRASTAAVHALAAALAARSAGQADSDRGSATPPEAAAAGRRGRCSRRRRTPGAGPAAGRGRRPRGGTARPASSRPRPGPCG